jgi:hypothetical protein
MKEKQLQEIAKHVKKLKVANQERVHFRSWQELTHETQIGNRMYKFYALKMFRKLIPAWREVKDRNNLKRVNLFKIREKLNERPELGRPLKAMQNFLLFKAFNQLCEGSTIVYDEAQMVHQANT